MNNVLKSGNGMNSPMGGKRLLRGNSSSSSSKKGGGMGGKKGGGMGAIGEEDRDPPRSPRMPGTLNE